MQPNQPFYNRSLAFAEIIESSLSSAIGQCWTHNTIPTFGSFVAINGNPVLIGCVTDIRHLSRDPSRIPTTYQLSEEELHREQPQIFALLTTQFTIKIVGSTHGETVTFFLPPLPANIHHFISQIPVPTTNTLLTQPALFESLLRGESTPNHDELILAIFRQLAQQGPLPAALLDHFYDLYRNYTNGDMARCRFIFKQLSNGT